MSRNRRGWRLSFDWRHGLIIAAISAAAAGRLWLAQQGVEL
jgi:hypothetical protein